MAHENGSVLAEFDGSLDYLGFIGQTLIFYIRMSLWPFSDINPQHPLDPASLGATSQLAGIASLTIALFLLFLLIRSRRWTALMLACWLISLLPVLNIIPLTIGGNIGHERFLALPLAFLALSAATVSLPPLSPMMDRVLPTFAGLIGASLLVMSIANIRVTLPLWSSELSLWTWAFNRHPDFAFVQASYVGAAIRYRDFDRAEEGLKRLGEKLSYKVKGVKALYLLRTDHPGDALRVYEDALKEAPNPPHEAILSAGIALEDATITRLSGLEWFYQNTYTGMAEAYLNLKEFEKALNDSQIAMVVP
jgi:protein O-mannosyl-transferase